MTVLTDHLPLLTGAPNGIKKLRELILELAVRGRLLQGSGCGQPYAWRKLTLPEVATYRIGKTPPSKEPHYWDFDGIPWVSISDMDHYGVITETVRKVARKYVGDNFKYPPVPAGSLLMSFKLTVGKVSVLGVDAYHNEAIISLQPNSDVHRDYLMRVLPTIALQGNTKDALMGATLNSATLAQLVVPLPSLDEQKAIVAKVDELMALCDTLETQQTNAESAHAQLVQALLDSLTQASDADDFAASWQRLSEHFDTLFTTEASIDALKQTVLQLAVMGKLVPQDPGDEPASELLSRIVKERQRLTDDEGLRTIAGEDVEDEEHEFVLSAGWTIYRLGNLARFIDYRGRTPTKTASGVPLITAKNVRPGFISVEPQEFIADADYSGWMTRGFPRLGDMLFTTEAPLGNVALIDIPERFALAQRVICLQLHEPATGPFFRLAMMSSTFQLQLSDAATGMTATGIKSARLKELPVPIPPLAEQHRIVAKVDELMSLCNQLKSRMRQARDLNQQLASTLVERAVA